jgi:hypothetical protein
VGLSALAPAACLALAGCSLLTDSFVTNDFSGDEFPIDVDLESGAVIVGLRQSGLPDRAAILDVMAPLTIINSGPNATQSVRTEDVYVLAGTTPRARLDGVDLVSHHPCSVDDEVCVVGPAGAAVPYQAILGAPALAGDAVRLRLGDEQVFILPDIGGSEADHTHACDGVFPAPYRGGGTIIDLGGTEVGFGGRRIALNACLGANPDPLLPQGKRGTDSLVVMSSGVGVSLFGKSAYERYRTTHDGLRPYDELPDDSVFLPSGLVVGKRATLDNIALVAAASSDTLAPCRAVYANHFMTARNCDRDDADCPCEDDSDGFCPVTAVVELTSPTGVSVLVVPDDNDSLQALRTELRPNQAEVDGIIGTDLIRSAEIDVDYPHNRLLARCMGDGCVTRPAIPEQSARRQAQGCTENAPGPIFE